VAQAKSGKHTVVLYANIWTTLLMLVFFFVSGISGGQPAGQNRSPAVAPPSSDSRQVLQGRVIVLDPGHGGADPGTIGLGYSTEAENALAIAWELKAMLEDAGAKVIMTRKTNVNPAQGTSYANRTNGQLAARTAIANHNNSEIFVSIHNDWNGNSNISGTTSYYYHAHDWLLADSIQKQLVSYLGSRNIGVKRGNFYVLRNASMPSALIEVGFLSNKREAQLLVQPWYRTAAAKGIFYGIVDYYQKAGLM
jgi:N-acetylmuramoyl-L-alanine amidase